jgi:hypothetical protein
MHNCISEYASTASISTIMIMTFHLKRSDFSPQISLKPLKFSRDGAEKRRERKIIEKRRKRRRKRKAPRVSLNKREVNILIGEKYFNFKNILFDVILFSPPSYHFKNSF